jgi:hypothetical protein
VHSLLGEQPLCNVAAYSFIRRCVWAPYLLGFQSACPDLQPFDVLATRHQGGRVYISVHAGLRKGDPRNEPREDGLVVCDRDGREIDFIQNECFEDANMLTGE